MLNSAIGQHLLRNKICTKKFNISPLLTSTRRRSSFYLETLKAIFIKFFEPSLYRKKEFLYVTKAFLLTAQPSALSANRMLSFTQPSCYI